MIGIEKLSNVSVFVDATHLEEFYLWEQYTADHSIDWVQSTEGFCLNLTDLKRRPINLCFSFVKLNGVSVAFFEPISELVDWKIIDKFFKDNFPNTPRHNAENFHTVLDFIKDLQGK